MHRIIFQIGPFTLYSYGLCVAVAFLLAAKLILREAGKLKLPPDSVFDCLIAILIGGLVGGRLLFVVLNPEYFRQDPLAIFKFYEGGLAVQGAIVAAAFSGMAMARVRNLPFWKTSDVFAPYMSLGQAIGRIGCFLNGCCYGKVIAMGEGLGVMFPGEGVLRIPVQIYSSLILLLIFTVLTVLRKNKPFDGYVFSYYVMFYSVYRFFMDFLRVDIPVIMFDLRLSQIISLIMFFCGAAMYVILKKRNTVRIPRNVKR